MPARQIQGESSPTPSARKDVEPGQISDSYGKGSKFAAYILRGHPNDTSQTGRVRTSKFIYALNFADLAIFFSLAVNLQNYLINHLHQDISTASTNSINFTGTGYLLAVFGGFVADTFLGHYFSVVLGSLIQIVGLALLVFSATFEGLQPPACPPAALTSCPPAGGKYTGVLYAAIYTIALGTGFIQASLGPFGAEQFDDSDEEEIKESIHFFTWLYFARLLGDALAFILTVYILNYRSKGWGFGYLLPLAVVCLAAFLTGTPKYRHRKVGGSFLTRIAQVTVAALRKRKLPVPEDESRLYDEPLSGGSWLKRSNKIRFLDKASIIEEHHPTTSKWRLAGVTQVEEAKRMYALLPVWLPTCFLSVSFAQVLTFTSSQGATLDRKWGPHFEVPSQTLGVAFIAVSVLVVPIYDRIILPLLTKRTGNVYGISPLKRVGFCCVFTSLSLACAALVEKKRLTYIRRLGYTHAQFFDLPMSMWWLLPQYIFLGLAEFCLVIPLYEFYYHEVSDATRSIAVSFLFSAFAMGYYFSSVVVNVVNHVTKHRPGGQWLKERLNNGGLERYFWLLAIVGGLNFFLFLFTTYFYQYNYDLFRTQTKRSLQRAPEPHARPRAAREIELEAESSKP